MLKELHDKLYICNFQAKFAGMDKDHDGQVSYDEYLRAMGAMGPAVHRYGGRKGTLYVAMGAMGPAIIHRYQGRIQGGGGRGPAPPPFQ